MILPDSSYSKSSNINLNFSDSSTEGAESTASTSNPFGPGNFSDVTTTKTTTPQTISKTSKDLIWWCL